ncbi:MAG: RNase adapter RapZ [Pseudomonadota bacterium]
MSVTEYNYDLIIISGLSGSGKSVALQSLEDIGYYCVDNLPAVLLLEFCKTFQNRNNDLSDHNKQTITDSHQSGGAAVSIDSRNKDFLTSLHDTLETLENEGVNYRVFYLDADNNTLLQRYSETRRKHPLTGIGVSLLEGIEEERRLVRPLLDRAEKVVDTSTTTPHELRGMVRDFAGARSTKPLYLIESFGFKHGSPREADFVFDVRCLPNPHWEADLKPLTGLDEPVKEFFRAKDSVDSMIDEVFQFLYRWLPDFASENRSYITVAVGCTGGRHRSVYICESLHEKFRRVNVDVQIRHRELVREQ